MAKSSRSSRLTEAECQKLVFKEARRVGGWLLHHGSAAATGNSFFTPVQGTAGFPDITMVHPDFGIAMFVELKRVPNKVEELQVDWLLGMRSVGLDARIWWVPEDLDGLLGVVCSGVLPEARSVVEMLSGPENDSRRGTTQRVERSRLLVSSHPLGSMFLGDGDVED